MPKLQPRQQDPRTVDPGAVHLGGLEARGVAVPEITQGLSDAKLVRQSKDELIHSTGGKTP